MNDKILRSIVFSVILISLHCGNGKEEKNDEHTSLILETMVVTDIYFYRYNCPAYTLLDAGTTTIHLNQGEEFWFDFKPRFLAKRTFNHDKFRIQIQESVGQDIKLSTQTCLVNQILSNPKPVSGMNPFFRPDSGLSGQLEIFDVYYGAYEQEGSAVTTIRATSGSGNVIITIPDNSL
ncbi:hypothetical protein [Leptospira kmetyi]|uniref:hypothetical protein n=1 Tax=Leptospira kmetyi TaxID=408139 RepID=UPI003EB90C92